MTLYKYISDLSYLENISKGHVKFTPFNTLNDPTEMFVEFNEDKVFDSLNQIRNEGYSAEDILNLESQAELLKIAYPNTLDFSRLSTLITQEQANLIITMDVYSQMSYLKQMLTQTVEALSNNLGVWSLTDNINNIPMWAYYANNAKGCVIVYQRLEEIFPVKANETSVLNTLKKVDYSRESLFLTFKTDSHSRLFYAKHSAWLNESEYRVVKSLAECETRTGVHTVTIDPEHVLKVVFGWKTTAEERKKSIETIRTFNADIIFAEAYIENYSVITRDIEC